ncbi:MAG TPA: ATP-dependent RecD-like DNA helicase [Polyangia bacterium]|nr:ATP-dependent RecD-like DNA helicase [Polyangia bacterium]
MDLFERAASQADGKGPEETLEGTVERLVFSGGEGTFTVARFKLAKARVGEQPVTIVGTLLGVPAGAALRVQGRYETTARFGEQFRVARYTEIAPQTLDGIRRYLGSGLIKGIGPEFAARIVERFGIETLEILDRDPGRISEVPGIGPARAKSIRAAWSAQREVRKVMVFLQGYGVSPAFAARIYKRYGAAAIAKVRENPYRLAFDVWGIGFLSADKLAAALGIGKESDVRVEAGVRHVIQESATNGDVFVPRERLVRQAAALLEVTEAMAGDAIVRLVRAGDVFVDDAITNGTLDPSPAVYDAELRRAELAVAQGLQKLMSARAAAVAIDVPRALAWYEQQAGLQLARQQAEAVTLALSGKVAVVTGGPGVGKTTIVRGIVSILSKKGVRVALAAPTGRAAKRLADQAGAPASTLHRLLEWRPAEGAFGRNAANPLDCDLLVVDEASMLDVRLAADLLASLPPRARLVLVGDVDQLPSVGPGRVLRDVIDSGAVPTVRLTEIFRQAATSLIVTNAHRIHDGELPELGAAVGAGAGPSADKRDFFFLEEDDAAKAAALVRDLVTTRLPRRYGLAPHDIQVLAPMHRGELGAGNLNALLQEALTAGAPGVQRGARQFRVGDKVMQIRNDYDKEVWNGDIGAVARVESGGEGAGLVVRFEDRDGEREVVYEADELDELALAYAATVHKSQGSEYPAVIVPVHTQHFVMLQRNLLYTAVTRGKQLVVLVGSRKALGVAVRNADVALRCSGLATRLSRAT